MNKKLWLSFGVCGAVFVCGLGTYIYFEYNHSSPSRSFNSAQKGGRFIEDSKILSKTDKIIDEPSALFNDPAISQAWGLKKSDAARAWSVSQGSREIIVAVIDTGIDINHEDIKANLWRNPGETGLDKNGKDKATNGIDDDGNGLVDDVYGWNYVSNNNRLDDNHGHGTHIAGIIGAEAGNGKGISGVAPQVSLMILKYYDPKVPGTDNLKNTVNSIRYAIERGAHIINYSGGGTEFSQEEFDAIKLAQSKGILFVAAAGNEHTNSDKNPYYPADYNLSNIISVTAIDTNTQVLSSSNYGVETVDIAAPGKSIKSLLPGSTYGEMTGTSQATAFVSGAAALAMAHKQSFKAEDVKKYILATGDAVPQLLSKTGTSRKLNMFKALTVLDSGVSASGVVTMNPHEQQQFYSDPNIAKPGTVNEINQFGRSLIDVIGRTRPERVSGNPNNQEGM